MFWNLRYLTCLAAIAALSLFSGCECNPRQFNVDQSLATQISVIHRPLNPQPEEAIRIIARTRAGAADITVSFVSQDTGILSQSCPNSEECELNVAGGVASVSMAIYSARSEDQNGNVYYPPSAYSFQVGVPRTSGPHYGEVIALRVPFHLNAPSPFRIAFVRDRTSYTNDATLLADIEAFFYDQLLQDPGYRWRDNQLAFYYYDYPGITTDYKSGLATRCGQAPWPWVNNPFFTPDEIVFADVIAVLHKHDDFRDCAGLGVQTGGANPSRRMMAHARRPTVVQHELGHALFGLGDEYYEDTNSRTARAAEGQPPPLNACNCCDTEPGGGSVGGNCPPLLPSCNGFQPAPECFPAESVCPGIESKCIKSEIYDVHDNIFDSEDLCKAAATAIDVHPGVILDANESQCRIICGPEAGQQRCPCVDGARIERWKLDRRKPTGTGGDIMETATPYGTLSYNGPACEHCMETTFCMLWELGRGQSLEDADALCYTQSD